MKKLDSIRPILTSRDNKVGNIAKDTLANASATLSHLAQEYHDTLWKIEILRLVNRYEAIRTPMLDGSTEDCLLAKENINHLEDECNILQQNCSSLFYSLEHIQSILLDHLNPISNMIEQMRDSVIAAQVSRTVQEIRPLPSYHRLEMLNPQIDGQIEFAHQFDNLSAEFQLLENENIRLQTEQEILKSVAHS